MNIFDTCFAKAQGLNYDSFDALSERAQLRFLTTEGEVLISSIAYQQGEANFYLVEVMSCELGKFFDPDACFQSMQSEATIDFTYRCDSIEEHSALLGALVSHYATRCDMFP